MFYLIFLLLTLIGGTVAVVAWWNGRRRSDQPQKLDEPTYLNSKPSQFNGYEDQFHLESHAQEFLERCISYHSYKLWVERRLSKAVRERIFKDAEIQYISLPQLFATGPGRSALEAWLRVKGVQVSEGDLLLMKMSAYLLEQSIPLAERRVENAAHKMAV